MDFSMLRLNKQRYGNGRGTSLKEQRSQMHGTENDEEMKEKWEMMEQEN